MTAQQPDRSRAADPLPRTRPVASYSSYVDAERAVDHLSDVRFPVARAAIVGRDLRAVERVTGRFDKWSAALQGGASGAVIGALFGWLFGLFGALDPLVAGVLLALYGLGFGAVAGAIVGFVAHLAAGGNRDFSSVTQIHAGRYDLEVDDDLAERAKALLTHTAQ